MLLSRKYLLVIFVSAIVLHHVAGIPAAKMSEAKDMETSKDSVDYAKKMGYGINYAKKMSESSSGGHSIP
uniref:Putative secreted protein n=1 Tax=Ixodes ricinus TaxID=34613 RepID=V5GFP3_IXORI